MTILRAGTLLLLLGFAAPVVLVWQTLPAHANDGGGDADGGDCDGDDGDDGEEGTEAEVRARRSAPATAPAVNFDSLNVGQPNPGLNIHLHFKGPG